MVDTHTPTNTPRGIRNHNPGNIRRSRDSWKGLAPDQRDAEFFTFISPAYGIRALARILVNYDRRHGLNTVRDIITRWAPPCENDTGQYVNAVARACGVQPADPIDVVTLLPLMVPAIIRHENGQQPYDAQTIDDGILMALEV